MKFVLQTFFCAPNSKFITSLCDVTDKYGLLTCEFIDDTKHAAIQRRNYLTVILDMIEIAAQKAADGEDINVLIEREIRPYSER